MAGRQYPIAIGGHGSDIVRNSTLRRTSMSSRIDLKTD
jgi:hypothetical protein